ncbi:MAG: hypothetical protein ACP5KD_05435 [Fervidobacterium sp.]
MKKLLTVGLLVFLFIFTFADALKFLPKDYSMLIYIPNVAKAYDAFKATPIGQTLLSDTGVGLESLVRGILEQQLLSMKYTMSDFDIFMGEMLLASNKDGNVTLVLGPVKNTTKMKKILESFLEADTMKKVKFIENYFVLSDVQPSGGKVPSSLQSMLKGNLGVTYTNITDGKLSFEGYGYIKVEGNGLSFYEKIDAMTLEAKSALKELQSKKPIDIFSDKNIGGDFLMFVNREIPTALKKSTLDAITSLLNLTNIQTTGTMYACADIGSVFSEVMNTNSQDKNTNTNINVSAYSVVFGTGFKMPADVKKYITIGTDKYGVITADNGFESYILIKSDRMITYTVNPSKYKAGDTTFFKSVYDPKYFAGVFINLEPLIYNMLGKKVKSSAMFVSYVEGESIIQKGMIK